MAVRETSTMISDFVLSVVCFIVGTIRMKSIQDYSWRLTFISWFGMIGFSIIGFAAFLGVVRFSNVFPRRSHSLKDWHGYFSELGSMFGLPMIAAAYTQRTNWSNLCWLFLVLSIISTLLHCIESLHVTVRDFCAAVSIIFILFSGIFMEYRGSMNKYSIGGSLMVIMSGVVGSQGRAFGNVKNVDIFHYFLAVGIYLFAEGLLL